MYPFLMTVSQKPARIVRFMVSPSKLGRIESRFCPTFGVGAFLLLAFSFLASATAVHAQASRPYLKDKIAAVWTFAIHFKEQQDIEALPEQVSCAVAPGSGKALIANGKPDQDATLAFGKAIAALRSLVPLNYPIPQDPLSGLDITLSFEKADLPHLGAGQSLAYAVAAYSALTSTPLLSDVALAGAIDEAGNVGPVEAVDLLVQSAVQKSLSTIILPAQNQPEIDQLSKDLKLKIRIVLVNNLHQALFYSLGHWGPQGQTYLYLLQVYRYALYFLALKDFPHATYFFHELAARLPEDTSFPLWLATVEEQRASAEANELVAQGLALLSSGDLDAARQKIEAALKSQPDSTAAKDAFARLVAVEQDSEPPQVKLVTPESNVFSPQQEVKVYASDNFGIKSVTIYIDGEAICSGNTVPFRPTLDTTALSPGTHLLRVEVTDISGNVSREDRPFYAGSP